MQRIHQSTETQQTKQTHTTMHPSITATNVAEAKRQPAEGGNKMLIFSIPQQGGRGLTTILELLYGFYVMVIGIKPYFIDMRNTNAPWCRNGGDDPSKHDWNGATSLMQKIIRVFDDSKEVIIVESHNAQIEWEIMRLDFELLKEMGIEVRFVHLLSNVGGLEHQIAAIHRFESAHPGKNLIIENQYSLHRPRKPLKIRGKYSRWSDLRAYRLYYSKGVIYTSEFIDEVDALLKSLAFYPGLLPQLHSRVILRAVDKEYAWFGSSEGIPIVFLASIFSQRLLPNDPDGCNLMGGQIQDWRQVQNELHSMVKSKWRSPKAINSIHLKHLAHQLDPFYTALAQRYPILVTSDMIRKIRTIDENGHRGAPKDDVECFSRIRFIADPDCSSPGWDNTVSVDSFIWQNLLRSSCFLKFGP